MKNLLLLFLALGFAGCGNPGIPETFDYGQVENNVYRNDFFDFTVAVPAGWFVQSAEEMDELSDAGSELIAGDNERLKRSLDVSEVNTGYLLTVFKYEVGALVEFNPSYLFVAENLSAAPLVRNGDDYLDESKRLLLQAAVNYTFPPVNSDIVTLGGKDFYVMDAVMNYAGKQIRQTYYSTVQNRFALSCIISYSDDSQKLELEELLETIQFF